MGGIILVASIIVWALGYFPHNEELDTQAQQEQSYIGRIGKTIEPIFTPQGFDWKLDVGLVSGVVQGDCSLNNGRALQQQRQFL